MTTETGRPGQTSPPAGPPTPGPEARCELTELFVSQCAHCKGDELPSNETLTFRSRLFATGRWIPAHYAGTCTECGEPFEPGVAVSRGTTGYVAECCAEDLDG